MRDRNSLERIQFGLTMFKGMKDSRKFNFIGAFKSSWNYLLKMQKINSIEHDIVLRVFGIKNSDTYRPTVQEPKEMQLLSAMELIDRRLSVAVGLGKVKSNQEAERFILDIIKSLKADHLQPKDRISNSVEKLLYDIYWVHPENKTSNDRNCRMSVKVKPNTQKTRAEGLNNRQPKPVPQAPKATKLPSYDKYLIHKKLRDEWGHSMSLGFTSYQAVARSLASDEIKRLVNLYSQALKEISSYSGRGSVDAKVSALFIDQAYIKLVEPNSDPCFGPVRRFLKVVSETSGKIEPDVEQVLSRLNLGQYSSDSGIVYRVKNPDPCFSDYYLTIRAILIKERDMYSKAFEFKKFKENQELYERSLNTTDIKESRSGQFNIFGDSFESRLPKKLQHPRYKKYLLHLDLEHKLLYVNNLSYVNCYRAMEEIGREGLQHLLSVYEDALRRITRGQESAYANSKVSALFIENAYIKVNYCEDCPDFNESIVKVLNSYGTDFSDEALLLMNSMIVHPSSVDATIVYRVKYQAGSKPDDFIPLRTLLELEVSTMRRLLTTE